MTMFSFVYDFVFASEHHLLPNLPGPACVCNAGDCQMTPHWCRVCYQICLRCHHLRESAAIPVQMSLLFSVWRSDRIFFKGFSQNCCKRDREPHYNLADVEHALDWTLVFLDLTNSSCFHVARVKQKYFTAADPLHWPRGVLWSNDSWEGEREKWMDGCLKCFKVAPVYIWVSGPTLRKVMLLWE